MSRRDAVQVLAMCSWVRRQISKIEDSAKVVADVSFPDEKTAAVVDETVVAYTSRVSRKPELEIHDAGEFVAWVAEHYPTEVVSSVRPSFLTILRDNALIAGAILGPGGEVCESAGLADPVVYTQTRLTKDADKALQPILGTLLLADLADYIGGAA
jgi:hypothetical protein